MLRKHHPTYRKQFKPKHAFTDEDAKKGILILLAACSETTVGVENLRKTESKGRQPAPNFGRYMKKDRFKYFLAGLPALWMNQTSWDTYFGDGKAKKMAWEDFQPVVDIFNTNRMTTGDEEAWETWFAVVDESMSGWRPKTTKTGGTSHSSHVLTLSHLPLLPTPARTSTTSRNLTQIRHRCLFRRLQPVPLGTQLKNLLDAGSGQLQHNEVAEGKAAIQSKMYCESPSHLPSKKKTARRATIRASKRSGSQSPPPSPSKVHMTKYRKGDNRAPTTKDRKGGRATSRQRQATCVMCRMWQEEPKKTTFTCPDCDVPLCANTSSAIASRKPHPDRPLTCCLKQHQEESDPRICCNPLRGSSRVVVPRELKRFPGEASSHP